MAVRYTPPTAHDLLPVRGVELGTANAGIKKWTRDDIVVMRLAPGTQIAGIFTRNRFAAAPVQVCRRHLAEGRAMRGILINAGNANAGTGVAGLDAARATCVALGHALESTAQEILPFSTGVIMEPLPVDRIVAAIPAATRALADANWYAAARAIMTTDTEPKGASRRVEVDGETITVTGIAKGAGMIEPQMATMLGFVATDAPIARALLSSFMRKVADASFNCISIDGDTSTNDSFVVISTGAAAIATLADADDPRWPPIAGAIEDVARELAQAIVRDGEGATKFITIVVDGGRDRGECDRVARAIANSPLVKTAFFASDPNLGRIVCAIGNAQVDDLDPDAVSFWLDDVPVVVQGGRAETYREEDGKRVMAKPEITVKVELGRGRASATLWTCDLSHDYVSINADYRS